MMDRDTIEVEALLTDRYLESLLATRSDSSVIDAAFGWGDGSLDRGVRLASLRLRRDLPRFHPSFRFEERLALRLAEAAASLRVAQAAGLEGRPVPVTVAPVALDPAANIDAEPGPDTHPAVRHARPLLIGGAMASAAISIAGAAWMAWRRSRPGGSPMARAVRAARAARAASSGRAARETAD
jgi:hypothetical protein